MEHAVSVVKTSATQEGKFSLEAKPNTSLTLDSDHEAGGIGLESVVIGGITSITPALAHREILDQELRIHLVFQ